MPRYDVPNAAPEPLRQVQLLVNSRDVEHGVEWLPEWLAERGLGRSQLERAQALREALRALVLAKDTDRLDEAHGATLDRAARAAHLSLRFGEDGQARLTAEARGVDGAFGRLLALAYAGMASGEWMRLKACPRDVCHWIFWDKSRNLSGKWCSMSVCGNRTKTRVYRRRHAGARAG
jgi:predicted RNA-binding Zn ribbon-like protein